VVSIRPPSQQPAVLIHFRPVSINLISYLKRNDTPWPLQSSIEFFGPYKFYPSSQLSKGFELPGETLVKGAKQK
jgi:hypothetical protein